MASFLCLFVQDLLVSITHQATESFAETLYYFIFNFPDQWICRNLEFFLNTGALDNLEGRKLHSTLSSEGISEVAGLILFPLHSAYSPQIISHFSSSRALRTGHEYNFISSDQPMHSLCR